MIYFILFGVFILVYYIFNFYNNVKKYPKGPTPLPFIGNIHQLDIKNAHIQFSEFSKKYGPVYTLFIPRPCVVLADYESIKEAYSNDDFTGRSGIFPETVFQLFENGGLVLSEGETWRSQRRFILHMFREFGMGKRVMEGIIHDAVNKCLDHLNSLDTVNGIDIMWPVQFFVGNVITKLIFNFTLTHEDCGVLKQLTDNILKELDNIKYMNPLAIFISQNFPSILKLPIIGDLITAHHIALAKESYGLMNNFLSRAREDFKADEEHECLAHTFMQKLAGLETTVSTIRWVLLYLAKYQDTQEKMRAEISKAIGMAHLPTMSDKQSLPFCWSALLEIQRRVSLFCLGVNHRTLKDTRVGNHPIPENTLVLGLLYNVLINSYKDGEEFIPDRFLMEDGVTMSKEKLERFIPFSIGKRVCAGESIAKMEIFIGVVAILQKYKIHPMPGVEVDIEPHVTFFLYPKKQKLRFIPL